MSHVFRPGPGYPDGRSPGLGDTPDSVASNAALLPYEFRGEPAAGFCDLASPQPAVLIADRRSRWSERRGRRHGTRIIPARLGYL